MADRAEVGANGPPPSRDDGAVRAPTVSLPKGGGAIRGIGEKFVANPARSGFGPQLSLSYDLGAANCPFGISRSLILPQIRGKTDKGLPRYNDAFDSDMFILSGAEDLAADLRLGDRYGPLE